MTLYEYQEYIEAHAVRNQGRPDAYLVYTSGPKVLISDFVCFQCGYYFSTSTGFRLWPEKFANMLRNDPAWQKGKVLEALFKNTKRVYPP